MTNKKLKLAAMSVALTACVAAQPMAAHAVEGPDSVEDNAAPQAEPAPVEGKTAEGEVEGEEEKQEEFVPPENDEAKKDDQAPAFGPGTDLGHDTKAKPEIWKEKAKFDDLTKKMQDSVAKLATAAKSGEEAQVKAAFGEAAKSCKTCHDDFRNK